MTLMKLLAIDLGASSGRVMQAIYNGHRIELFSAHQKRFYELPYHF